MLKYSLLKILGILLMVFGGVFFLATFGIIMEEGRNIVQDLIIGCGVLGALPAGFGFTLWRSSRAKKQKKLLATYERKILQLAADNNGYLNPSELAMHTKLTLNESTKILNLVQEQGHAQINVAPNGAINYYFGGLSKDSNRELGEKL